MFTYVSMNKLYYICDNNGGGSFKYLLDLFNYLKNDYIIIKIINREHLNKIVFTDNDILILQYFINNNITAQDVMHKYNKNKMQIIIPIHDYYYISPYESLNNFSLQYHNIYNDSNNIKIHDNIKTLFKIAKLVIFPSKCIKDIFIKYLDIANFIVSPHIDIYANSIINDNADNNSSSKIINIAVISRISECKGYEYLMEIFKINTYLHYKIKYHIFTDSIKFINNSVNIYNSYDEKDIYKIVKDKKINGLLYINKWMETYCYSLTHGINTELPIFYTNIGAVKERINCIDNCIGVDPISSIYDFNNVEKEKYNLINKYKIFLNYVIENNLKVLKNICLKTKIPFGYKYVFSNNTVNVIRNIPINPFNINSKINTVLITSKIIVSKNKLSNINTRSIYTAEERYSQTLDTIDSIRKFIPNSQIILYDNSVLLKNMYDTINGKVDVFINDTNNDSINYMTDVLPYKGISEVCQLLEIFKFIQNNNIPIGNIFKISGRYTITDIFDITQYTSDNVFCKNYNVKDRDYYYNSFYYINSNYIYNYLNALNNIYENRNNNSVCTSDLECILPFYMKYDFKEIKSIGIKQNISVWNDTSVI